MSSPGSLVSLPVGANAMPLPWAQVANSRAVLAGAWAVVAIGAALGAFAFAAERGHSEQVAVLVDSPPVNDDCVAFKGASAIQTATLWNAVGAYSVELPGCSYSVLRDSTDGDGDGDGNGYGARLLSAGGDPANTDVNGRPCEDGECDSTCEMCRKEMNRTAPGEGIRPFLRRDLLADEDRALVLGWDIVTTQSVVVQSDDDEDGPEPEDFEMSLEMVFVRGKPTVLRVFRLGEAEGQKPARVEDLDECSVPTIPLGYGQVGRLDDLDGLVVRMAKKGPLVVFGDSMRFTTGAPDNANDYFEQAMRISTVLGTDTPDPEVLRALDQEYPTRGCANANLIATSPTLLKFDSRCFAANGGISPDYLCHMNAADVGAAPGDRTACANETRIPDGVPVYLRLGVFDRAQLWEDVHANLGKALCARVRAPSTLQSLSVALSIFLTLLGLIPIVVRLVVRPAGSGDEGKEAGKAEAGAGYLQIDA